MRGGENAEDRVLRCCSGISALATEASRHRSLAEEGTKVAGPFEPLNAAPPPKGDERPAMRGIALEEATLSVCAPKIADAGIVRTAVRRDRKDPRGRVRESASRKLYHRDWTRCTQPNGSSH